MGAWPRSLLFFLAQAGLDGLVDVAVDSGHLALSALVAPSRSRPSRADSPVIIASKALALSRLRVLSMRFFIES